MAEWNTCLLKLTREEIMHDDTHSWAVEAEDFPGWREARLFPSPACVGPCAARPRPGVKKCLPVLTQCRSPVSSQLRVLTAPGPELWQGFPTWVKAWTGVTHVLCARNPEHWAHLPAPAPAPPHGAVGSSPQGLRFLPVQGSPELTGSRFQGRTPSA